MRIVRLSILSLAISGAVSSIAHAAPATIDSLLCQRTDNEYDEKGHKYLSVVRAPDVASVSTDDESEKVTVCRDPEKKQCSTWKAKGYSELVPNADGTLLISTVDSFLAIKNGKTGKVQRKITSKRKRSYSCGSGLWMGDTILAFGANCEEFDALPFLANGKTGKYIAPLVNTRFEANGETIYGVAHLDGKLWAISVYDHYQEAGLGLGTVYVVDTGNGKVLTTAQGEKGGSATIQEGKATRKLAKVPDCAP